MPCGFLKVSSTMQTNASLQERFAVLHKRFVLHSAYWQVVSYFVINTAVKFPSVISQPYLSGRTRFCITSRECHRTRPVSWHTSYTFADCHTLMEELLFFFSFICQNMKYLSSSAFFGVRYEET